MSRAGSAGTGTHTLGEISHTLREISYTLREISHTLRKISHTLERYVTRQAERTLRMAVSKVLPACLARYRGALI